MTASSRGPRAMVSVLRTSPSLCTRCATHSRLAATRRAYSSATPSTASTPSTPSTPKTSANILPVTSGVDSPPLDPSRASLTYQHPKSLYRLWAGLIVSRPPILTREQTPFESAFYLYQKRLNERLSTPFAQQFFFRKGQPAGIDFRIKWLERRRTMAREIGRVNRGGKYEWDDELLVGQGEELADPGRVRERLYLEAESRVSEDGERLSFEDRLRVDRPLSRETEADRTEDYKRLDRKLDRTLYLIVERADRWQFPQALVQPDEVLHETAERALADAAGVNMNTWLVGRHPVAYARWEPTYKGPKEEPELSSRGKDIFYLRARIMAGQADLTNNDYGATKFLWLTREELQERIHPHTFASVEKTLPAQ